MQAWTVFLKHLLTQPGQDRTALEVCCRLLATGDTCLRQVVHSTACGCLRAYVRRQPATRPPTSVTAAPEYLSWQEEATQHAAYLGAWLKQHTLLLHSLELDLWPEQEACIAAGLLKAAQDFCATVSTVSPVAGHPAATASCPALAGSCPAAPTAVMRSQHQLPGRPCCPAAPSATALPQQQQQQQLPGRPCALPLSRFVCTSATSGHLLCALASTLHLTELELHLRLQEGAAIAQDSCAALASLTNLQDLILAGSWCTKSFLPVLGPALQHLTQLTQLQLPQLLLDAAGIQLLPPSLKALAVCCHSKPLQLESLTNLHSLVLGQALLAGENLPPSVTALRIGRCDSVQPLTQLPHLRRLCVDSDLTPEQLHQLADLSAGGADGEGLESLEASYFCCTQGNACDQGQLASAAGLLQRVPLKRLKVLGQWGCGRLPAGVVEQLGGLTQLTALSLQDLMVEVAPQQLGHQLQRMPDLQQLELRCLQWHPREAGEPLDAGEPQDTGEVHAGCAGGVDGLARVLCGLTSLRELLWLGMQGEEADVVAGQLQSATQLTRFNVGEPGIDDLALCLEGSCTLQATRQN